MKIVVIGGTGLIGAKTVAILRQSGMHDVVAASPKCGVNTMTREGLSEAMTGAHSDRRLQRVVTRPRRGDGILRDVRTQPARGRGRSERSAPYRAIHRRHRPPTGPGLLPREDPQEKLIEASGIPYTIVRTTQFFEFLGGIADASTDESVVRLSASLFQPVAADDVAAAVAELAFAHPRNGIVEIAGPERAPFNEMIARYLKSIGDPRQVVDDPDARYFGGRLDDKSLVPSDGARLGHLNLDAWLRNARKQA